MCPVRDEAVPLVRFEDPAAGPAKKDVFRKERSIFADFPEDNPKLMQKCWEHDKQLWRIARLCKGSDEDYQETIELLRRNYQWLKNTFISICAASRYYPYVQMADYVRSMASFGILDGAFDSKALDRIYLAANLSNLTVDYLGQDVKHQNMMTRCQFMESIARCAQNKYMLPASIPAHEKKLPIALRKFLEEFKEKAQYTDPMEFRQ